MFKPGKKKKKSFGRIPLPEKAPKIMESIKNKREQREVERELKDYLKRYYLKRYK